MCRVRAFAALCVVALAGCGGGAAAVKPAAPRKPANGVFLRDQAGKVEALAAGDHLVAWTERTPPDRTDHRSLPLVWPTATVVVVADERGGPRLRVNLGARWVKRMRMLHSADGALQLAVHSCGARRAASCTDELWTLTGAAPVKVTARASS